MVENSEDEEESKVCQSFVDGLLKNQSKIIFDLIFSNTAVFPYLICGLST